MPAPSSAVLAACRAGTVQRHLLLYLNHPLGVVRAWDGVGNISFGGNTYTGVSGLGLIQGLSDSVDLQQHEVACTLNAVPLSALTADDGDIRGVAASVYAVLVAENGSQLASREIFTGYGDVLKTTVNGDKAQLTLLLRGLLADWSASPRSYYTPRDQSRLYAGDSGFDYVPNLQDSTVSGWNDVPETTGAVVYVRRNAYFNWVSESAVFYDGVTGELYGNEVNGLSIYFDIAGATYELRRHASSAVGYVEDVSGAVSVRASFSGKHALQVGGANCVVNVSNYVQTAGGALIQGNNSASEELRRPGTIASDGSATANTVDFPNVGSGGTSRLAWSSASSGSASWTQADWSGAVFNAADGALVASDAATSFQAYSRTHEADVGLVTYYYVEDVTGTAVLVSSSGAGKLQVGGVNCVVSTTGVVLSSGGRRIIRSGGDPAVDYLRVWT